jgi:hypothetical protein
MGQTVPAFFNVGIATGGGVKKHIISQLLRPYFPLAR